MIDVNYSMFQHTFVLECNWTAIVLQNMLQYIPSVDILTIDENIH